MIYHQCLTKRRVFSLSLLDSYSSAPFQYQCDVHLHCTTTLYTNSGFVYTTLRCSTSAWKMHLQSLWPDIFKSLFGFSKKSVVFYHFLNVRFWYNFPKVCSPEIFSRSFQILQRSHVLVIPFLLQKTEPLVLDRKPVGTFSCSQNPKENLIWNKK